jgi:hypothetical protein
MIADDPSDLRDSGFGREVGKSMNRRAQRFVEMGLATVKDDKIHVPVDTGATRERREIERVGHQMARERGLTYVPANASDYVSGRLAGLASLVSGRFAMIENGLGFQLVPWQPLLEKRIVQHISGLQRDDGHRVDTWKKPRTQLVMQQRRDCSLQLGRTAAALSRWARAAPLLRGWRSLQAIDGPARTGRAVKGDGSIALHFLRSDAGGVPQLNVVLVDSRFRGNLHLFRFLIAFRR